MFMSVLYLYELLYKFFGIYVYILATFFTKELKGM